jgi:hypothetical protein
MSSSEEEEEEEEEIVMSLLSEEEQKKRKRQRFWVQNVCKARMIHREFHFLYPDLLEYEAKFFEYFRMTYGEFMTLLNMLGPNLSRENTSFREAVGSKERLALCLR